MQKMKKNLELNANQLVLEVSLLLHQIHQSMVETYLLDYAAKLKTEKNFSGKEIKTYHEFLIANDFDELF